MTEASKKARIEYIDIAKGIGMILVIIGHCAGIPNWLNRFVFSVHMPLFFILSGYTFSTKRNPSIKESIKKNAKALLIPYAVSCIIIIAVNTILAVIRHQDVLHEFELWTVSAIYGSGTHYLPVFDTWGIPITFIGALWFLLAMFFARILFDLILRSKTPFLWTVASFFAGYVSARQIGWLPFSFQGGMCAVLFMYIGYVIRKNDLFRWDKIHWTLKVLMLAFWMYCVKFCGHLYMVSNSYYDGFLDIIGAVSGTFIIVYISQGLEKLTVFRVPLSALGRISLGVMCAHCIVLDCFPTSNIAGSLLYRTGVPYGVWEMAILFIMTGVVTFILFLIPKVNAMMFPAYRKNNKKA